MTTLGISLAAATRYCKSPLADTLNIANTGGRGLETRPSEVYFDKKKDPVAVNQFPIGIDPDRFTENLKKPKVQARIRELKKQFGGDCKLIVGVDRLDYIKGVPHKLHAFNVFLQQHPDWVGKVRLLQIAVPTRQDVDEYRELRTTVNELVGRINGQFGKSLHQFKSASEF